MKIINVSGNKGADGAKKKKSASSAGAGAEFADTLRKTATGQEPIEPTGTASINSVDSVLSVQEAPDHTADEQSRRQAREYGETLLDRLEEIRHGLLMGSIPKERLASLAQAMRAHRQNCPDPLIQEVLNDIELRAEVEIAKLTRDRVF